MMAAKPWRYVRRSLGLAIAAAAIMAFPREARPVSCVIGPWIIWFGWNDSSLDARARNDLDKVIEQYGICGGDGRLHLAGHTDRSGSGPHNLSLSKRRAEAVRTYLIDRGIPAERLLADGFGESRPLIEVPESRNRRVEIVLGPGDD